MPESTFETLPSALVFAAGFGTRMGELTKRVPKPMVHLGGVPMIDHSIKLLREGGIHHIIANTHYLRDAIEPHLEAMGVGFSTETPNILDTGGGLKHARPLLRSGPVLTMNPDVAWNGPNPVSALLSAWRPGMKALLLVVPEARALGRDAPGDFDLTNGRLQRPGKYVFTGVQIIDPSLTENVDTDVFSLNIIWNRLIAKHALHGVLYDGEWCDVGHPAGLALANDMLERRDVRTD